MEKLRHVYLPQVYFKAMWILALMLYILIPLQSGAVSLVYKGIVLITFGCFFVLFVKRLDESRFFVGSMEMTCFVLLVILDGVNRCIRVVLNRTKRSAVIRYLIFVSETALYVFPFYDAV